MLTLGLALATSIAAGAAEVPVESAEVDRIAPVEVLIRRGAYSEACDRLQLILRAPQSRTEWERARRAAGRIHLRDRAACVAVEAPAPVQTRQPEAPSDRTLPDRSGLAELVVSEVGLGAVLIVPATTAGPPDGGAIASAAIGGVGSIAVGAELGVNPSQAMMISGMGLAGGALGVTTTFLVDRPERGLTGAAVGYLGGTGFGLGMAYALPNVPTGDVAVVRSSTVWGITFGTTVASSFAPDRTRLLLLSGTGGALIGAGSGVLLASLADPRRGHINLVNLGTYGGLIAGRILAPGLRWDQPLYPIAIGGAVGLALTTAVVLLVERGRGRRSSDPAAAVAPTILQSDDSVLHPGLAISGQW